MKQAPVIPRLGSLDMTIMTAVIMTSKIFLFYPAQLIERDGRAAWLAVLLGAVPAILGLFLISTVMSSYPGESFAGVLRLVFPIPVALLLLITIWAFFLLLSGQIVREFAESTLITVLTDVSLHSLIFLLLGMVGFSLYQGLEPLARISRFFSLPLLLGVLGIFGLSLPSGDLANLAPVLGNGPLPLLRDGLLLSSPYLGLYFLYIFAPALGDAGQIMRVGVRAVAITAVFIAGAEAVAVLIFGYPYAAEFTLLIYQIVRTIVLSPFLRRIEAVIVFIVTVCAGITVMGAGWALLQITGEILGVEDRRPLIPPLMALIYAASLLPPDFQTVVWIGDRLRLYDELFTLGIPGLLWLVWRLHRRGEGR